MPTLTLHRLGCVGNRVSPVSLPTACFTNSAYRRRRLLKTGNFSHLIRGREEAARSCSAMAETSEGLTPPSKSPHVVICGGGVIGSCTAYFLAKKGCQVTVVEKTAAACAASGKAGGFLALDWCDGGPLGKLARASFELHAKLADELDGESYGYRRLDTLSVSIEESCQASGRASKASVPEWVTGPAKAVKPIGSAKTTAQVHPELFTKKVLSVAVEKYGAKFVIGEAKELKVELEGTVPRVKGLFVDEGLIEADSVVIAMGPWSATNKLVSALTTISPLKAHSIVLRPKPETTITPHALFISYKTREGRSLDSTEVYPRPTGEVYICGMSEETALPAAADQIYPKKESTAILRRVAATVSSDLANAEVVTEQACFLPCSEDNLPVIGNLPNVEGVYVATGHSCWGILNGPATGVALAELIADGVSTTIDLEAFNPSRFCNPVSAYFGKS